MAVVTVANAKGGVGKSTSAYNLQEKLGARILVDADIHGGVSVINSFRDEPLDNIINIKSEAELIKLLEADTKDSIILIDCGGFDDDITGIAIANCDMLIVPSNDNVLEEIQLIRMSERIDVISSQVQRAICGHVLLNRVHPRRTNFNTFDGMIEQIPNLVRMPVTIPTDKDFDAYMRKGTAVKAGALPVRYHHLAKYVKSHLVTIGALDHE